MEAFFVPNGDKFRGGPIATLPTVIKKDSIRLPAGELKFKTKNDLDHLRAEDRTQSWGKISANIGEAAEASKSEH